MAVNFHRNSFFQKGKGIGNLAFDNIYKGDGIGSFFSTLLKKVLPFLKNLGSKIVSSPITQNVASSLKDTAIQSGVNLAGDVLEGKNVKTSLIENLDQAKQKIGKSLKKAVKESQANQVKTNSSKQKKRKRVMYNKYPKKANFDIFS